MKGYFSLVLHAHLPFIRHPEYEEFLEEDWLYEAITETYIPLLQVFENLRRDDVSFRITLSLTPTLISMLRDEMLMKRYSRWLERLIELSENELIRNAKDATFQPLAQFYRDRHLGTRRAFEEKYQCDLVTAFRHLQDDGCLEIITSGATHGFLPLMQIFPEAVRAQIAVATAHYRIIFGRNPAGCWLPECGYFPGIERFLAAEGIRYFFVDTHGILNATPKPRYGVYAPLFTSTGTAAFGRDPHSSQQVWSSDHGYPGDYWYREFYRDIGYDLDLEYVRPYIQPNGNRKNTGIKYYRITGKTPNKQPYQRNAALARAAVHASDFMCKRRDQIEQLARSMPGRKPIIVAPYDAELFGHWWFEGPEFLDLFIRQSVFDQDNYQLVSPLDFLRENPENQLASPPSCSWGSGGHNGVWLGYRNDWIYRHLHKATERMIALAREFCEHDRNWNDTTDHRVSNSAGDNPNSLPSGINAKCGFPEQTASTFAISRALNQAARELLLAQSSDWAFIMKTGTMVDYATRRTKEHVLRFNKLYDQIRNRCIDEQWLTFLEHKDNLFPDIDYRVYRPA